MFGMLFGDPFVSGDHKSCASVEWLRVWSHLFLTIILKDYLIFSGKSERSVIHSQVVLWL